MTWEEAEELLRITLACRREPRLTCYQDPRSEACRGCPTFSRLEALVFSGTWTEEDTVFDRMVCAPSAPCRN